MACQAGWGRGASWTACGRGPQIGALSHRSLHCAALPGRLGALLRAHTQCCTRGSLQACLSSAMGSAAHHCALGDRLACDEIEFEGVRPPGAAAAAAGFPMSLDADALAWTVLPLLLVWLVSKLWAWRRRRGGSRAADAPAGPQGRCVAAVLRCRERHSVVLPCCFAWPQPQCLAFNPNPTYQHVFPEAKKMAAACPSLAQRCGRRPAELRAPTLLHSRSLQCPVPAGARRSSAPRLRRRRAGHSRAARSPHLEQQRASSCHPTQQQPQVPRPAGPLLPGAVPPSARSWLPPTSPPACCCCPSAWHIWPWAGAAAAAARRRLCPRRPSLRARLGVPLAALAAAPAGAGGWSTMGWDTVSAGRLWRWAVEGTGRRGWEEAGADSPPA